MLLILAVLLPVAVVDEAPGLDAEGQNSGDESGNAYEPGEGLKYYHDRGQNSFDNQRYAGSAVGSLFSAASGDLDNDGDADLVTAGASFPAGVLTGVVQIWENTGDPFASPPTWNVYQIGGFSDAMRGAFRSVDVGDFDNDGDLDVVAGSNRSLGWNIHLYENPMSAGLSPWAPIPAWGPDQGYNLGTALNDYITDIVVGDFENDGDLDIATGDSLSGGGSICLWRNDKDPFGGAWPGPFFVDMGDPSAGEINSLDLGDVDNDGDLDIVSAEGSFITGIGVSVDIWENPMPLVNPFGPVWSGGTGVTISPWGSGVDMQTAPLSVKFGDLDNDGNRDVLAGGDGGPSSPNFEMIENPGDPWVNPWTRVSNGGNGTKAPLSIGDLDNDGWLDYIANQGMLPFSPIGSGGVELSESRQDPFNTFFTNSWMGPAGGNFNLVADLDNDGDQDVVTGNTSRLQDVFVRNNTLIHRNMPFANSLPVGPPGPSLVDIEVGDLDNDGDLDVATVNPGATIATPTVYVWENNEPWEPASWTVRNPLDPTLLSYGSSGVKAADFDNDGDLDLATITEDSGLWTLFVWENPLGVSDPFTVPWSGGTGVIVGPLTLFGDLAAYHDVGDLDADGDVDIATHFWNMTSGELQLRIWQNPLYEGGDPFLPFWKFNTASAILSPFIRDASDIAAGDLDRDGDTDISTADATGQILIWENPNSTGVNPWTVLWSGGTGVQLRIMPKSDHPKIVLSDTDKDGDLEVAFALLGNLVAILMNPNDPVNPGNEPFTLTPWLQLDISALALRTSFFSIDAGDLDNDGDDDIVTGDYFSAGPVLLMYVTVFTNPVTEIGALGNNPWSYDEYPMVLAPGYVETLALGDLDNKNNTGNNKGGDLDILHNIGSSPDLFLMENIGAQVTEVVTPKSTPPTITPIFDATDSDLMTINVTHNGVSWDNDAELATWRFYFEDGGNPLTTGEAQILFDNMYIYRDTSGDDVWQPSPTDTIVMTIPSGSFSLVGGFQTFSFNDPDLNAVITADRNETYFMVVQLSPTASSAIPNTWNVTFDPDGYSTGNWNQVEHEDRNRILTVLSVNSTVAGIFDAISGTMPDLIPGDLPIPTGINVDGIPVTGTPTMSDRIDVLIGSTHLISSIVTNIGILDTGIAFTAIFNNCSSTGALNGPPFYSTTLGPLAPGASSPPFQENWVAPMIAGVDHYVCVFADSDNDIAEISESNNKYIIHFRTYEDIPPEISNVRIDGASSQWYNICALPPTINLTATVDDSSTGNSDIGGANYTTSAFGWPGQPMSITFLPTSPTEEVSVLIPTPSAKGSYSYYVYGWDVVPNYNTTSLEYARLNIYDGCPPLVQNVRLNGQPILAASAGDQVTVTATLNDTTTGNTDIKIANYTIGAQNWPGVPMTPVIPPLDNPLEDVISVPDIDTTGWALGIYNICVYGGDALGNNNTTGACAILSIAPEFIPPEIYNVFVDGTPIQTYYLSSLPAAFVLTATVDDTNTGGSFIGNVSTGGANYTVGAFNWPSSQPMNAVDGSWEDDIVEDVTVTKTTPPMPGIYVYCVYGWDQWFNYNVTGDCATLTIVDDLPPEIYNVLLNGSSTHIVTLGTPSVNLTAVLNETNTGQSNIGGANYTVGVQMWGTSVNMDPLDGGWNEISEDAWKIIDISTWGVNTYQICVYGWDSAIPQNNNVTGSCAQLTINPVVVDTPPTITAYEPGGASGQEYTQGVIITVTWTASDDNPLPLNPINITYGNPGSWIDLTLDEVNDGTYSWYTSNVPCPRTYWMNLTVYDSIGQKAYDVGNYSFDIVCPPVQPTEPPVIVSVVANPNPQNVGQSVTITATVTDADTPLDELTVTVEIRTPSETLLDNYTMTYNKTTGKFTYISNFIINGTYTYKIWAVDPEGNSDSEPGSFVMATPEVPPETAREYNWKPALALAFTMILLFFGILVSYKRPIGFKGNVQKDRFCTFLVGVLPFVIAEAATGVISLFTGMLSIPPIMGAGLAVDLAILIAGILTILVILRKGRPATTDSAEYLIPAPDSYQPPTQEGGATGMEGQEEPYVPPAPPPPGEL